MRNRFLIGEIFYMRGIQLKLTCCLRYALLYTISITLGLAASSHAADSKPVKSNGKTTKKNQSDTGDAGLNIPPDAKSNAEQFRKWLKQHPKKIFIASPQNPKLASILAENAITLTPKLGVMGVDFRAGTPKYAWVYAKKLIAVKCTYGFMKDSEIRKVALNLSQEGKNDQEKQALEQLYQHIHIKMECVAKEPISTGVVKSLIVPSGSGFPAIVTKQGAFNSGFFSSIYRTGMLIYILQL